MRVSSPQFTKRLCGSVFGKKIVAFPPFSPASLDEAQDLPDAASSAMKDMSTMIRGLGGKQTHFSY